MYELKFDNINKLYSVIDFISGTYSSFIPARFALSFNSYVHFVLLVKSIFSANFTLLKDLLIESIAASTFRVSRQTKVTVLSFKVIKLNRVHHKNI